MTHIDYVDERGNMDVKTPQNRGTTKRRNRQNYIRPGTDRDTEKYSYTDTDIDKCTHSYRQ